MPVYKGSDVPWNDSFVTRRERTPSGRVRPKRFRLRRLFFWMALFATVVLLTHWEMPNRNTQRKRTPAVQAPSSKPVKRKPARITESDLYPHLNNLDRHIKNGNMKQAVISWKKARNIFSQLDFACKVTMNEYQYLDGAMHFLTGGYKNFRRLRGRVLKFYHNGGSSMTADLMIRSGRKTYNYTVGAWTVHYSGKAGKLVPRDYKALTGKKVVAIYDTRGYRANDAKILAILFD